MIVPFLSVGRPANVNGSRRLQLQEWLPFEGSLKEPLEQIGKIREPLSAARAKPLLTPLILSKRNPRRDLRLSIIALAKADSLVCVFYLLLLFAWPQS